MELVDVALKVPKEMNDIKVALIGLVEDIKAKKGVAAIVAENIPALMSAIEGFDQLGEEAKSAEAYNLYALLLADLAKVLTAKAA